jgi:hypothetical protein
MKIKKKKRKNKLSAQGQLTTRVARGKMGHQDNLNYIERGRLWPIDFVAHPI